MKKSLIIMGLVVISSTLAGCSKPSGDEFIGTWIGAGDATKDGIAIEKNGGLYMMSNAKTHEPFVYCPTGASYQHSRLVCSSGASASYDAKNDKLLMEVGPFNGALSRVK